MISEPLSLQMSDHVRRRHDALRLMVALVASMALSMVSSGIVRASCVPSRTETGDHYHWVGYNDNRDTSVVEGIRSTIKTYRPFVPAGGFSYSWVMLTRPTAWRICQIGPYEVGGGVHSVSCHVG